MSVKKIKLLEVRAVRHSDDFELTFMVGKRKVEHLTKVKGSFYDEIKQYCKQNKIQAKYCFGSYNN